MTPEETLKRLDQLAGEIAGNLSIFANHPKLRTAEMRGKINDMLDETGELLNDFELKPSPID